METIFGDGGDGEWVCGELGHTRMGMDVATAAGAPWFPEHFLHASVPYAQARRDKFDRVVHPVMLSFHADAVFELFGKALASTFAPHGFFEDSDSRKGRRKSLTRLSAWGASDAPLMIRYTREKCVKDPKRMGVSPIRYKQHPVDARNARSLIPILRFVNRPRLKTPKASPVANSPASRRSGTQSERRCAPTTGPGCVSRSS